MNQRQYKKKDKKAFIIKKIIAGKNSRGDIIEDHKSISGDSPLWCFTQNLDGRITDNALIIKNEETRLFVFNYRDNICQGDLILFNGVVYEITRVFIADEYQFEIYAYVKKVDIQLKNFFGQ